jgi:hypothetical protein
MDLMKTEIKKTLEQMTDKNPSFEPMSKGLLVDTWKRPLLYIIASEENLKAMKKRNYYIW